MKKRILVIFPLLLSASSLWAAAQFKLNTYPLVDGIYNSTQTVISGRQPVFSWEFASMISSFTVEVNSDASFAAAGLLWNYVGSTTTANTINFITRIPYNTDGAAAALASEKTYYWKVTIYDNATSASAQGSFYAVSSQANLAGKNYDLVVDWNNPFNPAKGQFTKFRYGAMDRDRKLKLRVFTLAGELVREWPEVTALQNCWFSEDWDGKNLDGETVARGIYLVNVEDVGDKKGVTRKVAVIK